MNSPIRLSDSSSSLQREISDEGGMFFEYTPAPILAAQVSIDDCRRSELASILRDKESRETVRIIDRNNLFKY